MFDWFWFWFLKPLAEMAFAIVFAIVVFAILFFYYSWQNWKYKRALQNKKLQKSNKNT